MATRILITDSQGNTLACLDGHHGGQHAAEWATGMLLQFAAGGVDAIAIELHPSRGADDFRRDVLERAGQVRLELHTRPDGLREVIGLSDGGCAVTLVHAPDDVIGDRAPVRVARGRMNPAANGRTISDIRAARRHARAQQRGPA